MRTLIPIVLVILGVALIIASFVWPLLDDGSSSWTEEQAHQYTQAAQRVHELSISPPSEEQKAAVIEYQTLQEQLDQARNQGTYRGQMLRIAGLVALVASIAVATMNKKMNVL